MNWHDAVLFRDGQCVAPVLDREAGPCYDKWGALLAPGINGNYEADYVRQGAHGKRHQSPKDHVQTCPGHHRGTGPSRGYQWSTAHRALLREYLDVCEAVPSEKRLVRGWGLRAWRMSQR